MIPTPLPDELFTSALARMGRLNGINDFRDMLSGGLDGRQCSSFINAQLDLPECCKGFSYAYGTPKLLLEELTCFGLRRKLGEINDAEWRAVVQGHQRVSLNSLTVPRSTNLCFCRSCIRSDIEEFGEAYWHRSHQLPPPGNHSHPAVHWCQNY